MSHLKYFWKVAGFVGVLTAPTDAALVAWFDFEEGSGTTTTDQTSNGYTGSLQGDAQWVTSSLAAVPSGTTAALQLDGVGDYVSTNYDGIGGSGARSVALWFKTSTILDASLVGWGDSGSNGTKWHVRLNDNASNGQEGAIRTEIQGSYEIGGTVDLADGQWHHIVSVYQAGGAFGAGEVTHYVDGMPVLLNGDGNDTVAVNTTVGGSASPVLLGARLQDTNLDSLTGFIDEVRIYDNALTAQEVQALAVPEPDAAMLGLLAAPLLLLRRRRLG